MLTPLLLPLPDPAVAGGLFTILMAALAIDALAGDPMWLYRRVPHPVVLIGRLVGALESRLNRAERPPFLRKALGVLTVAAVVGAAAVAGWALAALLRLPEIAAWGWVVEASLASTLIAWRGLDDHVRAVARGLEDGGLAVGREAVRHIVGRDPETLDEAGVARAAIESAAENWSDGVGAPVFWFVLLGLPGLAAYKAVNTLDSMIGHRSERYRAFGWAAARLDDLANLIPARLSGLLFCAAAAALPGAAGRDALRTMLRDAGKHRSPNAGWPESATAGALGIALAGPRTYGDEVVRDPWIGDGSPDATAVDIRRALRLTAAAQALLGVGAAAGALVLAA